MLILPKTISVLLDRCFHSNHVMIMIIRQQRNQFVRETQKKSAEISIFPRNEKKNAASDKIN